MAREALKGTLQIGGERPDGRRVKASHGWLRGSYRTLRTHAKRSERASDELAKPLDIERLLQTGVGHRVEALPHARQKQPTRDEHDARGLIGGKLRHAVAQLHPVHPRHHHITKNDVVYLAARESSSARSPSVVRLDVKLARKDALKRLGHQGLIVDAKTRATRGRTPDGAARRPSPETIPSCQQLACRTRRFPRARFALSENAISHRATPASQPNRLIVAFCHEALRPLMPSFSLLVLTCYRSTRTALQTHS